MLKALAIKELCESVGLVALAAFGMAWVVAYHMGVGPYDLLGSLARFYRDGTDIAFLGDRFYLVSVWVVGGFAILLGLKQSAWELHHSTFYYLFHRPITRRKVLAIKLAVGMLLVFVVLALAILIYGSWAATPGHLAAPFEWSMTGDTWLLAVSLPLVYLGAFLSGIRPGRWFGSRFFPLVAAMLWVTFALGPSFFWWPQKALLVLGYVGWLMAIDYYTANRDY